MPQGLEARDCGDTQIKKKCHQNTQVRLNPNLNLAKPQKGWQNRDQPGQSHFALVWMEQPRSDNCFSPAFLLCQGHQHLHIAKSNGHYSGPLSSP